MRRKGPVLSAPAAAWRLATPGAQDVEGCRAKSVGASEQTWERSGAGLPGL